MTTNQDTKTCVHCKSEINKMASKCPHCGGKNYVWTFTRKLLLAFILFMAFIMFASSSIRTNVPTSDPTPTQASVSKVFDLNSLYGKNIDQVVSTLGKPESNTEPTSLQKQNGVVEWDKSFKKDDQTLLVTYNPSTRKIVDFFIATTDPSGNIKDISSIIKIAGNPSSSNFKTVPVPTIRGKSSFTGVRFVPNK